MYRCITRVYGLAFDADSFDEKEIDKIIKLFNRYKIIFMTSVDEISSMIIGRFGNMWVYKMDSYQIYFAPNQHTQTEVLNKLGIRSTELLYVSRRKCFLDNAMQFIGGTVWITDEVCYTEASKSPDLICRSLDSFRRFLDEDVEGFLGEVALYPNFAKRKGIIIPVDYESDDGMIPLYMLGRYFGYSHYMNQMHPYSSAIFLNKWEGRKSYGKFDNIFKKLISRAVETIVKSHDVDGICAVPSRPGHKNRFAEILSYVSEEHNIENYGPFLTCGKDYHTQKGLSQEERQENIRGVFSALRRLDGKKIIIIDDVITTGATINECIRTLKCSGVSEVYVVVLAINQQSTSYWSSHDILITCPNCGNKMHLLVNTNKLEFFYSCYNCKGSINYHEGRMRLIENVNN